MTNRTPVKLSSYDDLVVIGVTVEWLREFISGSIIESQYGCWLWNGQLNNEMYGIASFSKASYRVSRLSYIAFKAPIPSGLIVLHKCDNPPCCNPDHLSLGTQRDNVLDAVSKGRFIKGERVTCSKMTEDKVLECLRLRASGKTYVGISKVFGVDHKSIWNIINGKTWSHVTGIRT